MQGIAEGIKYLYQQFILRDVVAYVTPGTILAGGSRCDPSDLGPGWNNVGPTVARLHFFS